MVEQVVKNEGKTEILEKPTRHNTADFRKWVNNLKTYQAFMTFQVQDKKKSENHEHYRTHCPAEEMENGKISIFKF